ncbi:hypothetical protein Q0812_00835 [Brevundimonas sp. 2R-24]|uniref:Uncharacterized protein n=1 Tax=Peiella sedimenti TaxID=3061083 RepID=A0ABT8SHD5_9CAUL|nr:hypothetical protein [Caulobacteraceae bacterium XZ-24]
MASSDLKGWLTDANPLVRPATRASALRAARWGAISLVASALVLLLSSVELVLNRDAFVALMSAPVEAPGVSSAEADAVASMTAAMAEGMFLPVLIWGFLFVALYLGLAVLQWRQPNVWIPAIILVWTLVGVLGALSVYLFPLMGLPMPADQPTVTSAWTTGLSWIVQTAGAVLLITSIRGARALEKMPA